MAYRQNVSTVGSGALSMPGRQVCPLFGSIPQPKCRMSLSGCLACYPTLRRELTMRTVGGSNFVLQGKMGTVTNAQDLSEKLEVLFPRLLQSNP